MGGSKTNNENVVFKLTHIGINSIDAYTAMAIAKMFNCAIKEGNGSIFTGREIEIMEKPFYGTNVHIALETNDLERAIAKLKKESYEFRMDTLKFDENGKKQNLYLKDEISGFAVHLLQTK